MAHSRTVDVLLHLDLLHDVVSGTLEDGQGRHWPFYGWLELGSLLHLARLGDAEATPRLEPSGQPSSNSHTDTDPQDRTPPESQ